MTDDTQERLQPGEVERTCGGCGCNFAEPSSLTVLERAQCPRCNPRVSMGRDLDRQDDFAPCLHAIASAHVCIDCCTRREHAARAEGEKAATDRIAEQVECFAADYPADIWPEPRTPASDVQAAAILRRFAAIWAERIRQGASEASS